MNLNQKYKKGPAFGYTDPNLNNYALTSVPVVDSTAGTQYRGVRQDFAKTQGNGVSTYWNNKAMSDTSDDANTVYPMSVVGIPASADKNGDVKAGAGSALGKTGNGGNAGGYTVNANNQPYMDQLNALYDQIMNRKPFQYDLNGDLLYRQMADQYTQLGQQAMRDATGQAAALTGGYGNSYANQVGNQASQQYLTALNQQIPELYDRALNTYIAEGDRLLQQYELAAAHPGMLNAISPQTYYEGSEDTSGLYRQLLEAALSRGSTQSSYLPFENWVYRRNAAK